MQMAGMQGQRLELGRLGRQATGGGSAGMRDCVRGRRQVSPALRCRPLLPPGVAPLLTMLAVKFSTILTQVSLQAWEARSTGRRREESHRHS